MHIQMCIYVKITEIQMALIRVRVVHGKLRRVLTSSMGLSFILKKEGVVHFWQGSTHGVELGPTFSGDNVGAESTPHGRMD